MASSVGERIKPNRDKLHAVKEWRDHRWVGVGWHLEAMDTIGPLYYRVLELPDVSAVRRSGVVERGRRPCVDAERPILD